METHTAGATRPDTQLNAYHSINNLNEKRKAVAEKIASCHRGATLFDLAKMLGWPINRVSGRVTELKGLGLVFDSGDRRRNPESGKLGIVWKIKKAA